MAWVEMNGQGQSFTWVTSGYSRKLLDEFKSVVPQGARKWEPDYVQWVVAAEYWQPVMDMCKRLGREVHLSGSVSEAEGPQVHTVQMDYMGQVYGRGNDVWTANGFHKGDWNISFPLEVLQSWFNVTFNPGQMPTLYGVLGLDQNLAGLAFDKALKSAYRVAARTWHPDVNKEAIAEEAFKTINEAYEKLSDRMFRKRYDAGLKFEKDTEYGSAVMSTGSIDWYPPRRCGKLTVKATRGVKYDVHEILDWVDIFNRHGEVMVSSWPKGGENFEIAWRQV